MKEDGDPHMIFKRVNNATDKDEYADFPWKKATSPS